MFFYLGLEYPLDDPPVLLPDDEPLLGELYDLVEELLEERLLLLGRLTLLLLLLLFLLPLLYSGRVAGLVCGDEVPCDLL